MLLGPAMHCNGHSRRFGEAKQLRSENSVQLDGETDAKGEHSKRQSLDVVLARPDSLPSAPVTCLSTCQGD